MNKSTVTNFRNDLASAIKALESKYDIALKVGSIRYNDTIVNIKIEGTMQTTQAKEKLKTLQVIDAKSRNIDPKYLLPENAFVIDDQKEKYNGTYYISAFKTRGRAQIVLTEVNSGKSIKTSRLTIAKYID